MKQFIVSVLVLVVVLVVVMTPVRYLTPSLTTRLNIHGIEVGLLEKDVLSLLGQSNSITRGGATWIYYFGYWPAASQEFLEVDYGSNGQVISIEGEVISRGTNVLARVNDNEARIVSLFGPLSKRLVTGDAVECVFQGLTVHLIQNKVINIRLTGQRP